MPVPDDLVVKNGMKISRATSAGIGSPLLLNSRIGWSFLLMRTSMSVAWASMAFLVRLMNTWRSMLWSASSVAFWGEGKVPAKVGIERLDALQERDEREGFYDGSLKLGELAVTIHEVGKRLAGVVNRLNAFLVFASLDLRVAEISLADAGDGSRSVHDFVGKHTGQLLP